MVKLDIVGIDVENVNRDVIYAFTEQPTNPRKSYNAPTERSREKKREPRCPSCDYRGSDAITGTYIYLTQTPLIRSHVRSDTRIIGALGAALITIAISANNVYANSMILTVLSLNRITCVSFVAECSRAICIICQVFVKTRRVFVATIARSIVKR